MSNMGFCVERKLAKIFAENCLRSDMLPFNFELNFNQQWTKKNFISIFCCDAFCAGSYIVPVTKTLWLHPPACTEGAVWPIGLRLPSVTRTCFIILVCATTNMVRRGRHYA